VAILVADGGVVLRVGIPELAFDGDSLTVPRTAPGATGQATIALRNIGKGLLYTSAPSVTAPFTAAYDCDGTLEESEECEVTVSLSSTTRGVYTGTLTVPSSSRVPRSVTVQGLVGNDAMITATLDGTTPVSTVDFGNVPVGAPVTRTVLVRNAGDAPLTIATVAQLAVPTAPFAITDNQCTGQIIAAGATCPITVSFRPFGQDGAAQAFDITSNDSTTPRLLVQLVGVGTPPADIRVDAALAFPDTRVRDSAEATLLIRNVGRGPLDVQTLAVTEGGDEFTVVDADPFTVAPGESAERKVRFAPAVGGEKTARLVVTSNDPDAGDKAVTMTAIALAESGGATEDDGCAATSPQWLTLLAICAYAACRCARPRHRRTAPSRA
ncbi:MAG TPA: choice-of-anchor D domain-containing protein, partial [Myxococcota bacterium]|nr:choice-of-anchor D domain-containing protein [Myxococcota bacterium]